MEPDHGAEYVADFLPKTKIEITVSTDMVKHVIETLSRTAQIGKSVMAIYSLYDLEQLVRTRIGETGGERPINNNPTTGEI